MDLRRGIGYVIQEVGLFLHQKIITNVMTVPLPLRRAQAEGPRARRELLEPVGLDPEQYGDRYPHQPSGGQQQRVGGPRLRPGRRSC